MATARDRYMDKAYSEPLDKGRAAAARADMAEAFEEPDWVTPGADELAFQEAAERDHEHAESGWRRVPGRSQAAPKFEPPVDADGFQCGMCLLNRRQCLVCARREAEEINRS